MMSEKRFKLINCKLYDIQYNKDIAIATFKNVDDAEVICSWLNELYDENEQLKQKLENLNLNAKNDAVKMIDGKFFIRM